LELSVTLYIPKRKLGWHDVDNRPKDIMDALQGRAGGPKNRRMIRAIIPNDNQIFRVTIEKRAPPPQSLGQGHLTIRKYRPKLKGSSRPSPSRA
jgi:Holliday junction resolvase RusA-like endonuclease